MVTEEGITVDPGRVEHARTCSIPENSTEVNSFLGLASYYILFLDISTVAQPLYKLKDERHNLHVLTWYCQLAFDRLKSLLISGRVLAFPTKNGKFVPDNEKSGDGISAVISQLQDEVKDLLLLQVEHSLSLKGTVV